MFKKTLFITLALLPFMSDAVCRSCRRGRCVRTVRVAPVQAPVVVEAPVAK